MSVTARLAPACSATSLALVTLGLVTLGCGPKLVQETIAEKDNTVVRLRRTVDGDRVLPLGHTQPVVVSDVRIAHILASLTYEEKDGKRRPVIRSEHIYPLSEGISSAFEKAGPDDEIVAAAFWRERRIGIFLDDKTTSFKLFMLGDDMVFEFLDVDEKILEREPGQRGKPKEYKIPESSRIPSGDARFVPGGPSGFELIPGEAQVKRGRTGLAVAWRDAYYRRPISLSTRAGRLRRRTVIMELPPETQEGVALEPAPDPDRLTDAQLQALDELEAARRAGYVIEGEYRRRHRLILQGQLEEAGYGSDTP